MNGYVPSVMFLGVSANLFWCGIMFMAQGFDLIKGSLQKRHSMIDRTWQRFLYAQDFAVMTWGDSIGLSLVNATFCYLMATGAISLAQWLAIVVITIVDAIGFALMCLSKNHKPDYGYPAMGKISFAGALHLPYHGINAAMAIICLYHWLWTGMIRGLPMWIGLTGTAVYIAALVIDIMRGNFDPLKPEVTPTSGAGCRF